MPDIDLIPADYRARLEQRAVLRRYLTSFAVLNAALLACGFGLAYGVSKAEARAVKLKSENAITQQQQNQLQQLKDQQAEYERHWSLLRGLRAGAAVEDVFTIIDRSLVPADLWIVDLAFRRAGVIVEGEQRGIETGYFIIVPQKDGADDEAALGVETHMKIHGQARDHQALSNFVRALFEQEAIKDVNVRKTSKVEYGELHVVDFELTLVLNSAYRES